MAALTRRAVRANLRGLPNDSMYSTASRVTPSCSHHSSMSLLDTSSLSPTDANEEIPMPSRDRWSTMAKPRPPDCMTRPATPGRAGRAANVASRPRPGTATPKESGPISRMPYRRQVASRAPFAPASSPAVITTRDRAPRWPHCSATSSTPAAGTATTARSTASGRSVTEARRRSPSIAAACGFTG